MSDVLRALSTVFGWNATHHEYTTAHIAAVVNKLLGTSHTEEELLSELRQLSWAHPRPGPNAKHLLKWRFTNAPTYSGSVVPPAKRPRRKPQQTKSIAESQRLKR